MHRHFYTSRLLFATMCFISSCLSLNAQSGQPDSQQPLSEATDSNFSSNPQESSATRDSNIPAYRYYMVKITEVQDPYAEIFPTIQFAEFDLLDGNLHELEDLNIYKGTTVENYNPWGDQNIDENWPKAFDNNLATKYCNIEFNGLVYFMMDAKREIEIRGYRIYTADDTPKYPNRNPKSWKVYGSNDYTQNPDDAIWEIIDERRNDYTIGATNFTPYDFIIKQGVGVKHIEQDENTSNSPIYDLSGRRVSGMNRKGIYIVNGKKVLK